VPTSFGEIMDLFNNPWVVGIAGGILSGLVVAWITRKIFSKRDNREYFQKVHAANQEVLYAIRPGISEEKIPTIEVIKHLISATARKYSIESSSMLTLSEISSELQIQNHYLLNQKLKFPVVIAASWLVLWPP
jgi:hypothetical protein